MSATGLLVQSGRVVKRAGEPTRTELLVDGRVFDYDERDRALVSSLGLLPGLGDLMVGVRLGAEA